MYQHSQPFLSSQQKVCYHLHPSLSSSLVGNNISGYLDLHHKDWSRKQSLSHQIIGPKGRARIFSNKSNRIYKQHSDILLPGRDSIGTVPCTCSSPCSPLFCSHDNTNLLPHPTESWDYFQPTWSWQKVNTTKQSVFKRTEDREKEETKS